VDRIEQLSKELEQLASQIKGIYEAADLRAGGNGQGVLTDDEQANYDTLMAEYKAKKAELSAEKQRRADLAGVMSDLNDGAGRQTPSTAGDTLRVQSAEEDGTYGFRSLRDQLATVARCAATRTMDPRLEQLAVGSDEQSGAHGAYGGFLIAPAFRPELLSVPAEADPTAGLTMDIPMGSPILTIPARVDKDHSSSVSGGTTVTRRPEAVAATSSRAEFEQIKLEAVGLFGLTYVSEELLRRSSVSIAAILQRGFDDEFRAKLLHEKIQGTGAGEFEGILNAACKVSVAKEGAQAADTINGTNITKMRARTWMYSRAIWLANHDTYNQLVAAHIAGTNGDIFVFHPGNGTDVPDTLLGRPIFFTEFCKTLGDEGDLISFVPSEYLVGTEVDGSGQSESMHVRFAEHERAFKFWVNNDGAPWWRSALTPQNSTATLSPCVTLAERA
jgi:HK97 family phage major capsid protein